MCVVQPWVHNQSWLHKVYLYVCNDLMTPINMIIVHVLCVANVSCSEWLRMRRGANRRAMSHEWCIQMSFVQRRMNDKSCLVRLLVSVRLSVHCFRALRHATYISCCSFRVRYMLTMHVAMFISYVSCWQHNMMFISCYFVMFHFVLSRHAGSILWCSSCSHRVGCML